MAVSCVARAKNIIDVDVILGADPSALGALGVPVETLLEAYVPGKFVVTFRRGQVAVGHGKTF
jgi:hypothetical protein